MQLSVTYFLGSLLRIHIKTFYTFLFQVTLFSVCVTFFAINIKNTQGAPNITKYNTSKTNEYISTQRNETPTHELFHWEDYSVLATMLAVSCGIGVFYGYFGEKQTTGDDFLLGGSSMGTFPMALSLGAR